jgi:hypothetical protein
VSPKAEPPAWAVDLAGEFWERAGGRGSALADIEGAVALALPIDTVLLCRLTVAGASAWLASHGLPYRLACADRELHGCLVAYAGTGIAFLDGGDPPDERRFSLAHEISHFLRHYLARRKRVEAAFGTDALGVLDGNRPPTAHERINGALLDIEVSPYVHLMERAPAGEIVSLETDLAEAEAGALALELLAPADAVRDTLIARAGGLPASYLECRPIVEEVLSATYGLPANAAASYGRRLAEAWTGGPSAFEEWGIARRPPVCDSGPSAGINTQGL